MMWTCMEDVFKDLSKLNECDVSGAKEPYKNFYFLRPSSKSVGETNSTSQMVDPRTGETIVLHPNNDRKIEDKKLGFNSATMESLYRENELQNELQIVRKMRSSDDEVENYFCKYEYPEEIEDRSTPAVLVTTGSSSEISNNEKNAYAVIDPKKLSNEIELIRRHDLKENSTNG